jgi:ribosome maturation factor RimP
MKTKSMEELKTLLTSIADEMDIELVEVEFKMSKTPSLTVYIDTEDCVDLNTCEKYHRAIDGPLDEFDFTLGAAYTLNVSSPGLDRPLKTQRDFDRAMGQEVEIKLYAPEKGKKFFEGTLVGYDGNNAIVLIDGEEKKFALTTVAKINLAIIFD